jgi:hypothetical protein
MAEQTFRVRTWIRAGDDEQRDGLIGFLSLFVGDLIVDNVTLRRTLDGRYALSWPARVDNHCKKHASVRPLNDQIRQRIEREIFAELAGREELLARREAADG